MRSSPLSLHKEPSPLSGVIEVVEDGVERKLLVDGATQSIYRRDGTRRGYWEKLVPKTSVSSVLILGLGGGTVGTWIRESWPEAKVLAYELDPAVVRVASEYFHLDPAVQVRIADFSQALAEEEKYDLIIVDLYSGYKFLPQAETLETLQKIRDHLNPGGEASFNRVYVLDKEGVRSFEQKLRTIFREVTIEKANLNLIYRGKV